VGEKRGLREHACVFNQAAPVGDPKVGIFNDLQKGRLNGNVQVERDQHRPLEGPDG